MQDICLFRKKIKQLTFTQKPFLTTGLLGHSVASHLVARH